MGIPRPRPAPHEALFLLAALWAGLVPLVWLWPGSAPVGWHLQEMATGVAAAAMGGYLLLAQAHWLRIAGRDGAMPGVVPLLLVLGWLAGRVAGAPGVPTVPALTGLLLYPLGLAACLALPLIAARVWRRLPMALAPLLLVLIALRLRLAADSLTAVLALALLVALVGGRIVPAFLRAPPAAGPRGSLPPLALPPLARLADLALALALAAHLAGAGATATAVLLALAAAGQALRMAGWDLARGLRGDRPDLALLVIAWVWMPAGLALAALGLLAVPGVPGAAPLHALGMGLMGGMVLAVMARAWMRRVSGGLRMVPGPVLGSAAALVHLATLLRLALPLSPTPAALCWIAGWWLAAAAGIAALFRPVPQPVLSLRRP